MTARRGPRHPAARAALTVGLLIPTIAVLAALFTPHH